MADFNLAEYLKSEAEIHLKTISVINEHLSEQQGQMMDAMDKFYKVHKADAKKPFTKEELSELAKYDLWFTVSQNEAVKISARVSFIEQLALSAGIEIPLDENNKKMYDAIVKADNGVLKIVKDNISGKVIYTDDTVFDMQKNKYDSMTKAEIDNEGAARMSSWEKYLTIRENVNESMKKAKEEKADEDKKE